MRFRTALIAATCLFTLSACGSSSSETSSTDGAVPAEAGANTSPDGAVVKNDLTAGQTENCTASGKVTYVVNKFIMPTSKNDYAVDISGDGKPENALGGLIPLAAMGGGPTPQENVDSMVESGALLFVLELNTSSVANANPITLSAYGATDSDANATNNFTGSAEFTKSASNPATIPTLTGQIATSQLTAGPGDMLAPIPVGTQPVLVTVKSARIKGQLTCGGIENGQINGAISVTDLQSVMPDSYKNYIPMLADLDMDNDGTKDSLSFGMAYTAVSCVIK